MFVNIKIGHVFKEFWSKNTNLQYNKECQIPKFQEFWSVYPKRNGKKVGKKATLDNFKKIPVEELDRVIRNAKNYGIKNDYAKDPERFLKKDFWKDWDEPPESALTLEQKRIKRFGS